MKLRWKRPLACLLALVSPTAFAAEGAEEYTVCTCQTSCEEGGGNPACPVCGAEGADLSACAGAAEEGSATEDPAPAEEPEVPTEDPAPAEEPEAPIEDPEPTQDPVNPAILSWEWIGADNLNEGVLALPGVSEANPVDFDTVVSLLPTGVTATVDGSEEPVELALTWSCEDFPEQATQGEYTFVATLPEGYTLGEETAALTVPVVLGGAQPLAVSLVLKGYSLSLAGDIGVNFYMDLGDAEASSFEMQFQLPNGDTETVSGANARQLAGTTYYGFTCHVAARSWAHPLS